MRDITDKKEALKPKCNAPHPSEPGPMCANDYGHKGPHRSASGLFVWRDATSGETE